MRAARALVLTLMAILLTAGLFVGQAGAALGLSVLSPRFVLGTLDRLGLYDAMIDAAVAAAAPPPGSASYDSAMIIISAARETLSPELVRQTLDQALSQAIRLVKDSDAPPRLDVGLAPLREGFLAALTRAAQEHHATPSQIRQIEAQIRAQLPDSVDLVELLELEKALPALAHTYSLVARGLLIAVLALVLLVLLVVAVSRRAWGPWLSAPLLISSAAMLGLAIAGVRLGLPWAAKAAHLELVLPPMIDANTVLDAGYGMGYAVLRVFGLVGASVFVTGFAVLMLHRRAEQARVNRPVRPV